MSKPLSRLAPRLTGLALLLALILANFPGSASAAPSGQRLRDLAGSFLIGYASRNDFWNMSDSAIYQETARTEFNFMTPENAMKWDATEPSQNNFTFSQADQHVAFAQTNNMVLHGHTLVWHSQLPGWVSNGNWTSATLTSVMYNHIDTVLNHWDNGEIAVWDVVNESFEENGARRASVFQNVIGNSYIELAFQRARAADPQTVLLYNDYNIETINSKSNAVYNMAADFVNRGVPIDGIGFQMHLTSGGLNYQSFADNMARFAALGLDIYITEMDVRYPTPVSQANLNSQATIYANVLSRCLAQPACKALQVWGIPDKYSWVPDVFPGEGAPLLFDDNYNAKPAYFAVQTGLGGAPATNTPVNTPTRTNTPGGPSATPSGSNLLTNGDTEAGTNGWSVFGSGTLSSNTSVVHGGARSLLITGRTAAWNGIRQVVTSQLVNGRTYTTNIWVRSQSGSPSAKVTLQVNAGSTAYITLAPAATVNSSGWTLLSGTANVSWSGTLSSANLYVETNSGTDSFYIDDASFTDGTGGPTNTPVNTPTRTNTPPGPTLTPTRTPTRTNTPIGPTATPTRTATPGSGAACSPVDATIQAVFTFDGAGTRCWRSNNLGSFINSWNLAGLTVNGVDYTNTYAFTNNLPAPLSDGYWYISYTGNFPWSHFEAR